MTQARWNQRSFRNWMASLLAGVFLLTSLPALAAEPPAGNPELEQPNLALEGKRARREAYYHERRKKPGDPTFNAAAARLEAYEMMQEQLRQRSFSKAAGPLWANVGPAPTTNAQTPTNTPRIPSPVSGRVSAIAIDPIDEAIFIGGAQGGVWRSTDNGANWTALSDNLASIAVGSIAIDPATHAVGAATIYLGTGEGNGSCDTYSGVGVYKSTDSGDTWNGPFGGTEFTNRSVNSIAVDRTDSNHILATSASGIFGVSCTAAPTLPDRGVFRSTDAGQTWTKQTSANWRGSVVLQDPVTATTWWAAMWTSGGSIDPSNEGGLQRSTDNGVTWSQRAGIGGLPALATSWSRAWITATGSTIFVANGQSSGRVYRSTDSGATWALRAGANGYCSGQCSYDMPIHVEPGDPDILYTGGAGDSAVGVIPSQFMRSTDGGATFTDLVRSADNSTAVHADVHAITTWPGIPNRLWTGNDGGVWRSDDRGTNLVDVNTNLALTQFSGCDIHPTDPRSAYGGTQDNGTMGWTGTDAWPHLDFGDGGFAQIDQSNPNNLVHTYFNAQNFLIGVGWTTGGFATTQGGYCFSSAPGNGINLSDRVLFYAPIHLDRNATDTLYFGTHRLYRATSFFGLANCTGAGTFSGLGGGAGQDLAPGGRALSAIETVAGNSNLIFTGSNNGVVFRSTNGGTTFTQVDVGGSALYVSDIRVDPNDNNIVYQTRSGFSGAAGQHVRKSTDGGTTWAVAGNGLPDIPVNAFEFDPSNPNRIWVGTDIGTYASFDGGANWLPYNDGMATVAVFDLKAKSTTGSLVACTHGRSAYWLNTQIFADGFESGNTSAWSVTVP